MPLDRPILQKQKSFVSGIALAVLGALFTAACDYRPYHARVRVESGKARHIIKSIVGRWTSEPYAVQAGLITDTICFSPDGKYMLTVQTQAGPMESQGTYSTTGEVVTFSWAEGQETEQIHWEGSVLLLTSGERAVVQGLVRRFHRSANRC